MDALGVRMSMAMPADDGKWCEVFTTKIDTDVVDSVAVTLGSKNSSKTLQHMKRLLQSVMSGDVIAS